MMSPSDHRHAVEILFAAALCPFPQACSYLVLVRSNFD